MAAQREAFSTTLPLIELRSPTVPNKTNLIDPVYKNPTLLWRAWFWGFHLFIYSLCFPPLRLNCLCMWRGEIRFIQLLTKRRDRGDKIQKASKLDQWSQQSINGRATKPARSGGDVKWTFKTAGFCSIPLRAMRRRATKLQNDSMVNNIHRSLRCAAKIFLDLRGERTHIHAQECIQEWMEV